jgi:hypothetical protein
MRAVDNSALNWVLASPDGRELATMGPKKKIELNSAFLTTIGMFFFIFVVIAIMILSSNSPQAPLFLVFILIGVVIVPIFVSRLTGSRTFQTESAQFNLLTVRKKDSLNSMAIRCTSGPAGEPVFIASSDKIDYQDGKSYRLLNDVTNTGMIARVLGMDADKKYNRLIVQLTSFADVNGGGAEITANFADEDAPYIESLVAYTTYYYHINRSGAGAAIAR